MIRPLNQNKDLGQAIQAALDFESLEDSINYVCMWDEFKRTNNVIGSPNFGKNVAELLKIYGIDVSKIRRR